MALAMPKLGGMLPVQRRTVSRGVASRIQAPRLANTLLRTNAAAVAQSAVPTIPASMNNLTEAQRAELAEKLGFYHISKELPDTVTLNDVVKSMPREVFEIDHGKAWLSVASTIVCMAACLYIISISPWYMLPFAWALAGTAFTGFFVVGHDAAHRSFHKNNLVEDIVGTLMFMPLIFPFEPWRIKHNHHHAHTNKLEEDNAWHPVRADDMKKWDSVSSAIYRIFLGTPLKLWASIGHWYLFHFDLNKYTEKQKPKVIVSIAAVTLFAVTALPALVYYTGWWGLTKYWLMPWLGYHFWMSTFTVVHHTAPHISFKPINKWNAAKAQLSGTIHCDYPGWVEFLTHDISVHIPHHVSSKIPWYNLRKAHSSLKQNWGDYMNECTFNWRMMKNVITECHVFDEERIYKPFDFAKEETMFAVQRKVLPDCM